MIRSASIATQGIETPAFILDVNALEQSCQRWQRVCTSLGIAQIYPIKTNSFGDAIRIIGHYVGGFAVSSLFEARLAREIVSDAELHFTSPGLRDHEFDQILELCGGISFNSLPQWRRSRERARGRVRCGLRVNPQLSLVEDSRYDPCRAASRLGVPLPQVESLVRADTEELRGIDHLHFHTNCDSSDWSGLLRTVELLDARIPDLLRQCASVNLGGGYLLLEDAVPEPLRSAVELLRGKYRLDVVIEPGAGVVREAFALVSRVIDLFESDGEEVAILDTSVNHVPEAFEYQSPPDVRGDTETGRYAYILAGSTCLAGDVFGDYAFDEPLIVGSHVEFSNVGGYAFVKSHTFNGLPVPSTYERASTGTLVLRTKPSYAQFLAKTVGYKR